MQGNREPFKFVYQDECGEAGGTTQKHFIVGLLRVRDRVKVWEAIKRGREKERFMDEIHFTKISSWRKRAYISILEEVSKVKDQFSFSSIAVPSDKIKLSFFKNSKHLAYNYFTRLLMSKRAFLVDNAVMYADSKSRTCGDNFHEYIQREVNRREGRTVLKKVESICSKTDDLVQLTDLMVGCVNNLLGHASGDRKVEVRKTAESLKLFSSGSVWTWGPIKK